MVASLLVDYDLEAAPDHALRVEGQRLRIHHPGEALVLHRLRVHAVAVGARLVEDVGKEPRLAGLLLHRAQEGGALAPAHVVGNALAEFEGAVITPWLGGLLRHAAVGGQLLLRHRSNKAINVRHTFLLAFGTAPFRGSGGWGESRCCRRWPAECARRSGSPRSGRAPRSCRSRRGTPSSRRTGRR